MPARIAYDPDRIEAFCCKWKVKELALFGSVLRDDFGPDSDVDVLVTFEQDAPWSLLDWHPMMEELKTIFGREVDLVEKRAIKNPWRVYTIFNSYEVIHAAR